MSMYEIKEEAEIIPGSDGIYTRGMLLMHMSHEFKVYCSRYCWTCKNYSNNPGCRIKSELQANFMAISPKYWNLLLNKGLIE